MEKATKKRKLQDSGDDDRSVSNPSPSQNQEQVCKHCFGFGCVVCSIRGSRKTRSASVGTLQASSIGTAVTITSAPKKEKILSLVCPICNQNFKMTEVELDKHVDECLSVITLEEEKKQNNNSTTTPTHISLDNEDDNDNDSDSEDENQEDNIPWAKPNQKIATPSFRQISSYEKLQSAPQIPNQHNYFSPPTFSFPKPFPSPSTTQVPTIWVPPIQSNTLQTNSFASFVAPPNISSNPFGFPTTTSTAQNLFDNSGRNSTTSQPTENTISCPYKSCGMTMIPTKFAAHIASFHKRTKSRAVSCPLCMMSISDMYNHMVLKHNELTIGSYPNTTNSFSSPNVPNINTGWGARTNTVIATPPPPPKAPEPKMEFAEETLSKNISEECVICFENFQAGEKVARLACFCLFHKHCLERWLEKANRCPFHEEVPQQNQ